MDSRTDDATAEVVIDDLAVDDVAIEHETDPERAAFGDARRPLPLRMLLASGTYALSAAPAMPERPTIPGIPQPIPQPHPSPLPQPGPFPQPGPLPGPIPGPSPFADGAGLDGDAALTPVPHLPLPTIPVLPRLRVEEVRLDVDGRYPQMAISGTIRVGLVRRVHWIASLSPARGGGWTGPIWYRDGDAAMLPHTAVHVTAVTSHFAHQRSCTVTFTGPGLAPETRAYGFVSSAFREVELEYDRVAGTPRILTVDTHAHPNRPASMPAETLSINTVFARAGFKVRTSGGDSTVPLALAGPNGTWSDMEMHDAMQIHWSRFADKPQWSLWTLFAGRHDMGPSLGGIMFDSIGPNHRQGTALFLDSFISDAPPGEAAPDAWVRRMRFWTAIHEMGHAFNLAHSWQKTLGTPWIPLANEPGARSFMNYPFRMPQPGGEQAFFADFDYRFSDSELLFMRHAPERFVQQGNADWFDHHGFEQAVVVDRPVCTLEVRINRDRPVFEFMEPVSVELKLKNVSSQPVTIDASVLTALDDLTLVIKRQHDPARQFRPYIHRCVQPEQRILGPGEALYETVLISAGVNGFDLAEPGRYLIQAALHLEDGDIVAEPLHLRVLPPRSFEEEHIAQDVTTDQVGRILTFGGSLCLDRGNAVLHEVVERLGDTRIARHAQYALGNAVAQPYKVLDADPDGNRRIAVVEPEVKTARQDLDAALLDAPHEAAETFGHIAYKRAVDRYTDLLVAQDAEAKAAEAQHVLLRTLSARGVLPEVLADVERCRDALQSDGAASADEPQG